jgi:hypothetical protein
MSIFRLVLCLAGLAAYLVVKQWVQTDSPAESKPTKVPASPEGQRTVSPQTTPHSEILPPERSFAEARK